MICAFFSYDITVPVWIGLDLCHSGLMVMPQIAPYRHHHHHNAAGNLDCLSTKCLSDDVTIYDLMKLKFMIV